LKIGGRNFENFSEDPVLTGELGASYIVGVQNEGIAATPKHFACNECELDRSKSNSIVSEKVLREMYLLPFQICMKKAAPLALMTSYNKVNGTYCSESTHLLQEVVRKEWGFPGLIMSDFRGTYSEVQPVLAGLNLETPGPSIHRGQKLLEHIKMGHVLEADIDANARYVIALAAKVGMDDEAAPEQAVRDDFVSSVIRETATEGVVLLKNQDSLLPISADTKIALFGAPASIPIIHGGGSPTVNAHYTVTPLEALKDTFKNIDYLYGVPIFRKIPSPQLGCMTTPTGEPGIDCQWFNGWTIGEDLIYHERLETMRTLVLENNIKGLNAKHCTRMTLYLTPKTTGRHSFGITANGETHLYVDREEVLSHPGYKDTLVEYIMEPGSKSYFTNHYAVIENLLKMNERKFVYCLFCLFRRYLLHGSEPLVEFAVSFEH
jgi:beta-glucosidase